MIISHLVAVSENNVIGKNNQLPWNLPNDFKYFKNKTWGMPVVMGRKTYESMEKELKGRINIVVTTNKEWKREIVIVTSSIDEGIKKAEETDCKEIFIIGGGEIFKQSMDIANRLYITRVHASVEGDTFYPSIDETKWKLISEDPHPADEKHQFAYTFQVWDRKTV
jgi:dihydrofolate reductase